jgi:DNA-binding transcriptional LysR family regulator
MLDVRRLRVLREVARQGSLSAAAAVLGYTQPAVSRQIAVLEAEAGVQLLRRLPQGVALTDAGRLLATRGDELISSLERVEDELRAQSELGGGTLRLAAFASSAASVVPIALMSYRRRYPAVELSVIVADPADSLPLLRRGELDLALWHERGEQLGVTGPPVDGGVELVPLFEDPMYVALPAGHPQARTREVALTDLERESWLLCTTSYCPDAQLFLRACHETGFEPQIAFQYDDYPALLGFVAAGLGIAVIPDMVARGAREDVVVRTVSPALPSRPILAALPAGYRSPTAAAMVEVLHELTPEWEAGRVGLAPALTPVGAASFH